MKWNEGEGWVYIKRLRKVKRLTHLVSINRQ